MTKKKEGAKVYAVTVTFQIKPEFSEEFLPLMLDNARASKQVEPGCQQFDVCRDGNTIFLYEVYDDRAAFDAHLAAPHFKAFNAKVGDMVEEKDVVLFSEVLR